MAGRVTAEARGDLAGSHLVGRDELEDGASVRLGDGAQDLVRLDGSSLAQPIRPTARPSGSAAWRRNS
jgi:hypothetical protein